MRQTIRLLAEVAFGAGVALALAASAQAQQSFTLGYSTGFLQDPFQVTQADRVMTEGKKAGLKTLPVANAANDAGKQITDFHNLISEGAQGILLVARDSDAIVPALNFAESKNVPVVAIDMGPAGGKAVMTRFDHPSGSDRIFEALGAIDPAGAYDVVVNVQGDLPTIEPSAVRACLGPLAERAVDIATLATPITREQEKDDPNVVKIVATELGPAWLRALYFTRARAPWGDGRLLHHIGLYAYRRDALRRFVGLPLSPLEKREKLEQLRALENGMRIACVRMEHGPFGVDTAEDLERARAMGADHTVNYRTEPDWEKRVLEITGGRGVDVVLDMVGGPYIEKNISLLRSEGRLLQIAFLQGSTVPDFDFMPIMLRRLTVTGSTLRPRTVEE